MADAVSMKQATGSGYPPFDVIQSFSAALGSLVEALHRGDITSLFKLDELLLSITAVCAGNGKLFAALHRWVTSLLTPLLAQMSTSKRLETQASMTPPALFVDLCHHCR